jgi:hypothetical protein
VRAFTQRERLLSWFLFVLLTNVVLMSGVLLLARAVLGRTFETDHEYAFFFLLCACAFACSTALDKVRPRWLGRRSC